MKDATKAHSHVMAAAAYVEICKVYGWCEHVCTFIYAVNSFTMFEIGRRIADGLLIIIVFAMLTTHAVRKAGIRPLRIHHFIQF